MEDARLFVEGADANGDGGVSREELSHVLETNFSQVIPATFLEDSFSGYDLDGDGAITVEEMQNVVREVWAEQDRQTGS